ncbi:MAG: FAD-binding protein, partial [Desulfosarcinaceae bacterium]
KAQVDRYNELVEAGQDTEFGKQFFKKIYLNKPPFYAARAWVKVHHCMGGVQINTKAQVIHMETGEPIPGLFAAGEATGGIHGATRLGSCAIADCLVMGRIAGESAASRTA